MVGFPTVLKLKILQQIILYRYNQYIGSYRGNHLHKKMSNHLRDTYFYPKSFDESLLLSAKTLKRS